MFKIVAMNPFACACVLNHLEPADRFRARASCPSVRAVDDTLVSHERECLKQQCVDGQVVECCKHGWIKSLQTLETASIPDFEFGLGEACRQGSESMTRIMISMGARGFDSGLWNACYGGHHSLAQMMLWKAYAWRTYDDASGWFDGFSGALAGRQREMMDMMISIGIREGDWNLVDMAYNQMEKAGYHVDRVIRRQDDSEDSEDSDSYDEYDD